MMVNSIENMILFICVQYHKMGKILSKPINKEQEQVSHKKETFVLPTNPHYSLTPYHLSGDVYISFAFHPTENIIAVGKNDGSLEIHGYSANRMLFMCLSSSAGEHTNAICSIAFNHNGTLFATASCDNSAKLWEVSADGKNLNCVKTLIGHDNRVQSVAFNCDGTLLITGSDDNTAYVWQILLDSEDIVVKYITTLDQHTGGINAVAFHPTRPDIVATGSEDHTIILWNIDLSTETADAIKTLIGHAFWVSSLVFLQDGTGLVSGSYDGTVKIWNCIFGESLDYRVETIGTPNGEDQPYDETIRVNSVAFDETTDTLAIGKSNGVIEFWSLSSNDALGTLNKDCESIRSVVFNGRIFASLSIEQIIFYLS
jgi:WD40 repeat protein